MNLQEDYPAILAASPLNQIVQTYALSLNDWFLLFTPISAANTIRSFETIPENIEKVSNNVKFCQVLSTKTVKGGIHWQVAGFLSPGI
jgi:hypothetical protein